MSIKGLMALLLVSLLMVGCAGQMGRDYSQSGTQTPTGVHDPWWH